MFSVQLPFETIDCWKLKNTHTCECCIDFLCLQQHLVTLSRSTLPPSLDQWSKLERDILIIDYVSWESLHRLAPLSISFTFAFHAWTFSFFFEEINESRKGQTSEGRKYHISIREKMGLRRFISSTLGHFLFLGYVVENVPHFPSNVRHRHFPIINVLQSIK